MDVKNGRRLYRCTDPMLVRAARHVELSLPAWPDLTGVTPAHARRWGAWLREVWAVDAVAEAIEHASPVLARQVEAVCAGRYPDVRRARRMVLSVAGYLLRTTGRATPFGLFAGVAPTSFSSGLSVSWGDGHRTMARADASWLAEVIVRLEACPRLLGRLSVTANDLCFVRGGRLIVPYRPQPYGEGHIAMAEVSIRHTAAVRTAVEAAGSPIRGAELVGKLAAEFPTASSSAIDGLLSSLVEHRALISGLHAPSTVTDAFGHLMDRLEAVKADEIPQVSDLVCRLREIRAELARHNRTTTPEAGRAIRAAVTEQATKLGATTCRPPTVDLRLDCSLSLPRQVAAEAEAAVSVLARLTAHPFGTAAWQDYHTRFFERYGINTLVPVMDVVDPDVGLGFPQGYPGATTEARAPVSARDRRLLALAQAAVLDGREEVVLDEHLVADLAVADSGRMRVPPHAELCFRLQAVSQAALECGEFDLAVLGASRGIGTMTGRFIDLLESTDRRRMVAAFARLPTSDPETLPVQLSFSPPTPEAAHVMRVPELLPTVITLAEHREPSGTVIGPEDLAVGCDGHRLYLASFSLRRRLEPMMPHALDLRAHTPPLARFLTEIGRAQDAVVTGFDWGAASCLPFLPRVRYGRTVLSPARWLLESAELGGRDAPWPQWRKAFAAWRARRRLPGIVYLTDGDRRLRLDLDQSGHLALLRAHLDRVGHAALSEAPTRDAYGWFGGRTHEIVVSLTATRPSRWPVIPPVASARPAARDDDHLPGASPWLSANLYGHPDRQTEILAEYLPGLLAQWEEPPVWWFIRYRDPQWHLRLRIALPDARGFGSAAHRVGTWTGRLQHLGLLREIRFVGYRPETGRWGDGAAMAAAEAVFGADSRALLAQFARPSRPDSRVLAAAHFVAITTAFTGGTETGMNWLIEHAKTGSSSAPPRPVLAEAVRLADPTDDWATLRAVPGGEAITEAWRPRHQTLADYRAHLAEGDMDGVLTALLHAHHIRAVGVDPDDERICLRLARAAALAWNARTGRSRM